MSRARVVELVRSGRRFLVTCHVRPDADALGSAMGWAAILRTLGKEVCVFNPDPPPRSLSFLPGIVDVVRQPPGDSPWDACFVMDAAAGGLVPEMPASLKGPVVMFDHHAAHDAFGDIVLRETDAPATGVLVLRMMRELGVREVPGGAAAPLYAAIVADTGGFRYEGTDPETLRMGAELVEAGADPWTTAYHLFEGWSKARMKLLAALLEGMELILDDRVAVQRVTRRLLARCGADDEMVEGMVNFGRMLEGIEISVLLWELTPEDGGDPETKVSLRSSGRVDVSTIATALDGGGHRAAAGANVHSSLAETEARVLELARDALARAGFEQGALERPSTQR